MNQSNETSLELAGAIADGEAVDWDEVTSSGDNRRLLEQLRAISKIGDVHEEHVSTGSLESFATRPELLEFIDDRVVLFRWGHLDVLKLIGEGTYGEVYRAYDPKLRTDVALKLLKAGGPDRVNAFVEEGRKLAQVRHPNVVTIHGIDCHDDRHGIWMELVDGATLEEVIQGEGVRSADEAVTIGLSISSALAAVHQQGLIHRDVKTSNVKRDRHGRIVLLDFSLTSDCVSETTWDAAGTPAYMAPETLAGGRPSAASDIYSLGAVLYRLVSKHMPLETSDCAELLSLHRQGLAVPLRDWRPDLPIDFVAVVDRALDPDPDRRFQSAGEFEHALRGHAGHTITHGVDSPIRPGRPRWIVPTAAIVVAAVAAWFIVPTLAPFEVEAALFKAEGDVDQRLRAGSTVLLGDKLFLEITGSKDMYVYIVNEDEVGNTFLLFPLPASATKNPLPARERHQLPGMIDGESHYWNVTSAGGAETILVVASKKPQPDLERLIAQFPASSSEVAAVIEEPDLVGTLRGIGGLSSQERSKPGPGEPHLPQVLVTASENSGVWMWEMILTNPPTGG